MARVIAASSGPAALRRRRSGAAGRQQSAPRRRIQAGRRPAAGLEISRSSAFHRFDSAAYPRPSGRSGSRLQSSRAGRWPSSRPRASDYSSECACRGAAFPDPAARQRSRAFPSRPARPASARAGKLAACATSAQMVFASASCGVSSRRSARVDRDRQAALEGKQPLGRRIEQAR